MKIHCLLKVGILSLLTFDCLSQNIEPFPNTQPLTWEGDIASRLIDSCDVFLLNQIDLSVERRQKHWQRDFSSASAYENSIKKNRTHFTEIIGVKEERLPFSKPTLINKVGESKLFTISEVRWPVFEQVNSEGLLVTPIFHRKNK
jgi:hypothetical protein